MSTDVRSPFVFDTQDLGRRPGATSSFERSFDTPEKVGTDIIAIPVGEKMRLEGHLESVVEGVYIHGRCISTARGECARCLDPVSLSVDTEFSQLFTYPGNEEQTDEADGDVSALDGDLANIMQSVVDAVGLGLPFKPLCTADCPGLCPEDGHRLSDVPDHANERIDPRWSALSSLVTLQESHEEK